MNENLFSLPPDEATVASERAFASNPPIGPIQKEKVPLEYRSQVVRPDIFSLPPDEATVASEEAFTITPPIDPTKREMGERALTAYRIDAAKPKPQLPN